MQSMTLCWTIPIRFILTTVLRVQTAAKCMKMDQALSLIIPSRFLDCERELFLNPHENESIQIVAQ